MRNRDNLGGGNDQDITEETDAQYQAENESRSGSAILYGVFALVVTLIVAAGLFFGGRAVYRALTDDSGDNTSNQEGQSGSSQSDTNNGQENNDGQVDSGSDVTPSVVGDNDSDTEDNQADDSGSSENMPSTGDNLPSTGSPFGM